jgi:DNA-binding transcriptional regulator YiaG
VKGLNKPRTRFNVGGSVITRRKQAIARAEAKKVRVRGHEIHAQVHVPEMDVRKIRGRLHLSQAAFASRYGLARASVENWEQGNPAAPQEFCSRQLTRSPRWSRALQAYVR